MGTELLKSLIDESVKRALEKNKLSEEYYKYLNKHTECTKCFDKITRDNYKKDRSICRKCYSKYMLEYNSNRRGEYNKLDSSNNFDSSNKLDSSRKQDVSSKTDSSNNFDSSNKQEISRKQDSSNKEDIINKPVRSRKQNSSNKQVKSDNSDKLYGSINIKNIDPDCLMEKFTELYNNKYESFEESQPAREHCKEILAELLRVKAITKREYNTLYKKYEK